MPPRRKARPGGGVLAEHRARQHEKDDVAGEGGQGQRRRAAEADETGAHHPKPAMAAFHHHGMTASGVRASGLRASARWTFAMSRDRMRRSITRRAQAGEHDRREEQGEAERADQQRVEHGGRHRRLAEDVDRVGLVQRVPPVDAVFDDRQVHRAHQRQDGGGAEAALLIVEGTNERDLSEIEEEQHEHRGQPRIPHPPGAPTWACPRGCR